MVCYVITYIYSSNYTDDNDISFLSTKQTNMLKTIGYCKFNNLLKQKKLIYAIHGFIRENNTFFIVDVMNKIVEYHGVSYNSELYVEIEHFNKIYLMPRINVLTSLFLVAESKTVIGEFEFDVARIKIPYDKISTEVLLKIFEYLNEHKNVLPPHCKVGFQSLFNMQVLEKHFCKWDVNFITSQSLKEAWEIRLSAAALSIIPLMDLATRHVIILLGSKTAEQRQCCMEKIKEHFKVTDFERKKIDYILNLYHDRIFE